MLDELTPEQLTKWQAAYYVHGWGDEWWKFGMVAAATHNAQPGTTKLGPDKFIPPHLAGTTRKRFDVEAHKRAMEARFGGRR